MVNIIKQNDNVSAYVKEYVVDYESDIEDISLGNTYPGSTCICIENSEVYMLNGEKKWKKL